MLFRCLFAFLALFVVACATAPTVIDPKNDPSNPAAAEGPPMPLMAAAPDASGLEERKPSGDKMQGMDMPGMNMNSTKNDQNKGDNSK
jgi:hypothetical protein